MIIKDIRDLDYSDLDLNSRIRILKSRKKYAVLTSERLHLVDDIERLSQRVDKYDYNVQVYEIN